MSIGWRGGYRKVTNGRNGKISPDRYGPEIFRSRYRPRMDSCLLAWICVPALIPTALLVYVGRPSRKITLSGGPLYQSRLLTDNQPIRAVECSLVEDEGIYQLCRSLPCTPHIIQAPSLYIQQLMGTRIFQVVRMNTIRPFS